MPYYLPIAGRRIIWFIPFPRVLVLCEMQSVSSRIWTRVVVSIPYDDNHYTTSTSVFFFQEANVIKCLSSKVVELATRIQILIEDAYIWHTNDNLGKHMHTLNFPTSRSKYWGKIGLFNLRIATCVGEEKTHTHTHIYIYIYICVCVCVCMYV